jgi:hypothetical protein
LTPSGISSLRIQALATGKRLASVFEDVIHAHYRGPLVVGGGFLRDLALNKDPKDLDLFLDGGKVEGMAGAEEVTAVLSNSLKGATLGRTIRCYGEWAEDVLCVCKVVLDPNQGPPLDSWPKGCVIPDELDLVFLLRSGISEAGYLPRMVNDVYNQEMFLKAVLARVDLRLNALGATPTGTHASPQWDLDAYNSRLVIQKTRTTSSAVNRLSKRLARLTDYKFRGWSMHLEQPDGSLAPFALGVET